MSYPPGRQLMTIGSRIRKSPYFDSTIRYGVKAMTIYNHTYLPTVYTDAVSEYWSLVTDVTAWDVACERQIEITGPDALAFIQLLTPRDMSRCQVGQCQYLVLTDQAGGIVNDAIMLRVEESRFWLSPGDGDVLLWALGVAVNSGFDVRVDEPDVSPLQIGGPKAPQVVRDLLGDWALDLRYYWLKETSLDGIPLVVARTGWSGELSYELYLRDGSRGDELWERVMEAGKPYKIVPAAPSAIRSVEGGILSYGADITREDNPFTIGMDRFIELDQPDDFIGKQALIRIKAEGPKRKLVGIELDGERLPGANLEFWPVSVNGERVGRVTRCVWSPRLDKNIGFANVPTGLSALGTELGVASPGGERRARVCEWPWFDRHIKIPK